MVTDADIAVEDAIRTIAGHSLGVPVIGEERGVQAAPGSSYWLVDPICGTRNFASGIPLFAVNMALVEQGEVVIGVVGDGSSGAVHVAERGRGSRLLVDDSAKRLRASADSRTIVVDGGPPAGAGRDRAGRFAATAVQMDRWDFRSLGTTLALAYIAAGRVASYVLFSIAPLHAAAGALLAEESGAIVTDLDGRPWGIDSSSLLASANNELHRELVELLHRQE